MSTELMDAKKKTLQVSSMAETLIGSEIIQLAWQINDRISKGQQILNLTIGDFNPNIFPIPDELTDEIKKAYDDHQTNYPPAEGTLGLRKAISSYIKDRGNLDYGPEEILVSSGARPIIFAVYNTVVDLDDVVIFPVPSWNNNHYCHLTRSRVITIETTPENNFMPTAEELEPHVKEATLISLCSPLNPTGTCFSKNEIQKICDLVINENNRRGDDQKPLYVLFDQIYWQLTLGDTKHYNPVVINPEMRDYTIFVDGISKAFAATGVRVGWGYGPKRIIDKMKSITSHMGAWAPKAEQVAVSKFLLMDDAVDKYIAKYKSEILDRVNVFYKKFKELKNEGYNVDVIAPQASIFLTLKIDLTGYKKEDGTVIQNTKDITNFLIEDAHIALVPFASFGSSPDSKWFRVAVGTCTVKEIEEMMENFKITLSKLTKA